MLIADQKKILPAPLAAAAAKKSVVPIIRIGWELPCLPYAGFLNAYFRMSGFKKNIAGKKSSNVITVLQKEGGGLQRGMIMIWDWIVILFDPFSNFSSWGQN